MGKISNILCKNPIVSFCTFIFCCSFVCIDYCVFTFESDSDIEAGKYKLNVDSYAVKNRRPSMEDRFFIDEKIGGTNVGIFAVFDGHGGKLVSTTARNKLMPRIRTKIQEIIHLHSAGLSDAIVEPVEEFSAEYYVIKFGGLVEAFKHLLHDEIMLFDERMNAMRTTQFCGSTAVIAIVIGHHLIVANVGDSRAILGNLNNVAIRITKDHKPDDKEEKARIESMEFGRVTQRAFDVPRVNNILAMSRALGDSALKEHRLIIATPDIFEIDLRKRKYHPKYLVIASDGIWDVLEDQEVIDLIHEYEVTESPAKRIVHDAISYYSYDNITILIITFEKRKGAVISPQESAEEAESTVAKEGESTVTEEGESTVTEETRSEL